MTGPWFGPRLMGVDLIVVVLGVLVVLALVRSVAVSPLPWILVVILALFAVLGRGRDYGRRGWWLAPGQLWIAASVFATPASIFVVDVIYWPDSWSLGRRVWAVTR